jgi:hypothetical protein
MEGVSHAGATSSHEADRVEECKARLATLFSHDAQLDVELSELESAHKAVEESVTATRRAVRTEIKPTEREYDAAANARASELDAVPCEQHAALEGATALSTSYEAEADVGLSELDAAHKTDVQRVTAKREALRADIEAAKIELDVAVNAPVSGGSDPTESLPDELMEDILLMLLLRRCGVERASVFAVDGSG